MGQQPRIHLVLSPHMNYYHSFRGDSEGSPGFGHDIRILDKLLDQLDAIEATGLNEGITRMCWDFADTFWTIQIQQQYEPRTLQRIIDRCKAGKDEVLIGSWSNSAQTILDHEEFQVQDSLFHKNAKGIGVNELFGDRVCPYARTQETMFTQGMIEEYQTLGVKGICLYYSAIPFDNMRPFLPRLTYAQQYGINTFKSAVSDATMLVIPTYNFGDSLDNLSLKSWLMQIHQLQLEGKVPENALVFFNFDMDVDTWTGLSLPSILKWMPNSNGVWEIFQTVTDLPYVNVTNLLDIVPNLTPQGEITLYPDVGDGCFNGYYNWAQKYNNSQFWWLAQLSRWEKCVVDSLFSLGIITDPNLESKCNYLLRGTRESLGGVELDYSYLENHLLVSSTTNFGMSVPFIHANRRVTSIVYLYRAYQKAHQALDLSLSPLISLAEASLTDLTCYVIPVVERKRALGSLPQSVAQPILIPENLIKIYLERLGASSNSASSLSSSTIILTQGKFTFPLISQHSISKINQYVIILNTDSSPVDFSKPFHVTLAKSSAEKISSALSASPTLLTNGLISVKFSESGKISEFLYGTESFGMDDFLFSGVRFGSNCTIPLKKADTSCVKIHADGTNGQVAQIELLEEFSLSSESPPTRISKILTLYPNLPYLFIEVHASFSPITGQSDSTTFTTSVRDQYDPRWQEIMPCEIRPAIFGKGVPLTIWKYNYLGRLSHLPLNMAEVDAMNFNIDVLSSNISDGWMGISDEHKGLLIGYDATMLANFAFTPLKIANCGFSPDNVPIESSSSHNHPNLYPNQTVRINPFGTYFGKMLHYWTEGTGHAQEMTTKVSSTFKSTAPSYAGQSLQFRLMVAPFKGSQPPENLQNHLHHFSLPPAIVGIHNSTIVGTNFDQIDAIFTQFLQKYAITKDILEMDYLSWVRHINRVAPEKPVAKGNPSLPMKILLKLFLDGLKAEKPKMNKKKI